MEGSEPQAEQLIQNMWNRMKDLEGKYMNLANYYKDELQKNGVSTDPASNMAASKPAATAVNEAMSGPDKFSNTLNEDQMVSEIKNEKQKFE